MIREHDTLELGYEKRASIVAIAGRTEVSADINDFGSGHSTTKK